MSAPDPKPTRRVKATKKQWADIIAAKVTGKPCRAKCGRDGIHAHHLVSRAQGGGDVAENIAPLCAFCHDAYHNHTRDYRWVADRIGWHLSSAETVYMTEKKGLLYVDRAYPMLPVDDMQAMLFAKAAA